MMMRKKPKFCVIFCDEIHNTNEQSMTMRTAERSIAEPLLASFLVSLVSLVACAIAPILTRLSSLASVSSSSTSWKKSNARAMALFGSGALLADACTHGIPNSFGKLDGGGGEFAGRVQDSSSGLLRANVFTFSRAGLRGAVFERVHSFCRTRRSRRRRRRRSSPRRRHQLGPEL